jgi:tetratricopeptide (TPR) repeat protein
MQEATALSLRASPVPGLAIVLLIGALFAANGCAVKHRQQRLASEAAAGVEDPFDAGSNKPPTAETMYGYSKILLSQGRAVESIAVSRNIIQQHPGFVRAYNTLAEAHLLLGQMEEAIEALMAGLQRSPDDSILLNNLGMVFFIERRYEDALPQFERAVTARPEERRYRANKAATLAMLGRTAEAAMLYRQIVRPAEVESNIEILKRARRSAAPVLNPTDRADPAQSTAQLGNSVPELAVP